MAALDWERTRADRLQNRARASGQNIQMFVAGRSGGFCSQCGKRIKTGSTVVYDNDTRKRRHAKPCSPTTIRPRSERLAAQVRRLPQTLNDL